MTFVPSREGRDMARRLLADEGAGAEEPAAVGAALQRQCTRLSENLRRAVGDDGYNALVGRAIKHVESGHPPVASIRRITDAGIHLDGVVASIDAHGVHGVTTALEALFAALIDLLSSLIGADMVLNILDLNGIVRSPSGGQAS